MFKNQAPDNLAKLLEPFSLEDFFANYGKNFRYIQGVKGKFSNLFPWETLNQILRQHRLDFPRLRLFLNGAQVPTVSYLKQTQSQRRRQVTISKILNSEFIQQLRNGATLVVDAVDELYEPLTTLAESLELDFHEHIQINLYAGWYTSPGFDLHWDDHDVLILQVAGKKNWSVYGASREYPLARDIEDNVIPPDKPIWTGVLSDGDLLYIPRGWWHVATPISEPTLHLTVGIHNRTGIDLFSWLLNQMREYKEFRMDLPRFSSKEEQNNHMQKLYDYFLNELNENLLEKFLNNYDSIALPRVKLGLPWVVMPDPLPKSDNIRVKINTPRKLNLLEKDHSIEFSCNGKTFAFAKAAKPLIESLAVGDSFTIKELSEKVAENLDFDTVHKFLSELIINGLIVLDDVPNT